MRNKKIFKILFIAFLWVFVTSAISGCSCTSSMCSDSDIKNIKTELEKQHITDWRNNAALAGINIESEEYTAWANNKLDELSPCAAPGSCTEEEIATRSSIKNTHNNEWLNELETLNEGDAGYIPTRSAKFAEYVSEQLEKEYKSHAKACLVTHDDVDPQTGAKIEAKTWGDAWKTGLLEGLIVYPISWLLSVFVDAFGGANLAQLFAILLVVVVIRTLMLLLNFRGQISTIKMQSVQGEISAISDKLKDPTLTQAEKQALSIKMMDVYKKNDIHPFSSLISQFISFPIFIAVWAAMNQTLAIRKGSLLGLEFGTAVNTQVFKGSIAAIVLFLLMIGGQVITMRLPVWLRRRKEAKKNNGVYVKKESSSDKQMNIMMFVMIALIVFSGFLLPAALVIYWFFGSIFSIFQTLVFNSEFVTSKLNNFANRKKKAKVIR